MTIEVLFFAQLREQLGTERTSLEVPPGFKVQDVMRRLQAHPEWQSAARLPLTYAVNEHIVDNDHPLRDGDRLALLTPVSGG